MIGIVLVAHCNLAREMLNVVEHVVGHQEKIAFVSIEVTDDIELKRHEILEKTAEVDTGDGVIVVTDMFGGTPSNLAISIMEERNIEVISGMNIPLLVKLMQSRSDTIADAVTNAQNAGKKYINIASHLLRTDA